MADTRWIGSSEIDASGFDRESDGLATVQSARGHAVDNTATDRHKANHQSDGLAAIQQPSDRNAGEARFSHASDKLADTYPCGNAAADRH